MARNALAGSALFFALTCAIGCGSDEPESAGPRGAAIQPTDASDSDPNDPPGAQWDLVESLRAAAARVPDPSDGGGRAWLEPDAAEPPPQVGEPGRFTLVYETGPLGIATGGMLFLQIEPFWGWSTPQVEIEEAPGFTSVTPSTDDIELEIQTLDQQLLGIRVTGRPLAPGERLRIVYGAGPAGVAVDRFAENGSRFWIAVDGDGDGERAFLPDSPRVDVAAGPPARLLVTAPTTVRPDGVVRLRVAVLDALGSAGTNFTGTVEFENLPDGLELPQTLEFAPEHAGVRTLEGIARKSGSYRLRARTSDGLTATSNPIVVSDGGPRVLWGDLHGHSQLSDGTGTVDDYFAYARDVAGLDVVALSDHDHWGIQPLDEQPEMWAAIKAGALAANVPGQFVTLLAYEWTSWIHGHRHVLYFGDDGAVFSSLGPEYESPTQLWAALAKQGRPAITLAHHSAGGPIPTNWEIPPDPRFEPVTEIVSVHGSSEAADSPHPIYNPVRGNYVRDVLGRGYRLGFLGSGDSHDGHPGLAHLGAPSGGLAAILAEDLSRESILKALRARRVYATNGPRILLRAAFGNHGMGSIAPVPSAAAEGSADELFVHVVAETPLDRIDVIRSGEIVTVVRADGLLEVAAQIPVPEIRAGEFLYVRAVQQDDGAAWSSPIFFE